MFFIIAISLFLSLNTPAGESLSHFLVHQVGQELVQKYGKDSYRFDVSIRYVPNSLTNISPDQITGVVLTNPNMPTGYAVAKVDYEASSQKKQVRIQLFVDVWEQLLVPKQRIMPGEQLSPEMFDVRWVKTTRLQGRYLKNYDALQGKISKRLLPAGKPVTPAGVRDIPVINFGDTVTLQYQKNGILLSLSCTARQPGAIGDRIKVYCKDTRKTYEASVINASTVKWENTL